MKYCNLGDLYSSAIVMGCMRIADKPLTQVEKVIFEAMKAGVNTFDLADVSGGGDCEKVFGVAIKDLGVPRKDFILQTKCGIRKNASGKIVRFDFTKEHIINSVEGSLKRLNTEYLDVLLLHRPDTLLEPDEVGEAFERLRDDGKVKAFGVSNFNATQIQLFRASGIQIAANQVQFSLKHTPLVDAGFNVKMYKDEVSADFHYNLKNNIRRGAPSKEFLWPKMLLDFEDGDVGYMMDLRPTSYVSFVSYLTGKNKFKNRRVMLRWCVELCLAFKRLHTLTVFLSGMTNTIRCATAMTYFLSMSLKPIS